MSSKMKKIRVEVVAEVVVPAEHYKEGTTNEQIADIEEEQYEEWILDKIVSDKITVTDVEGE